MRSSQLQHKSSQSITARSCTSVEHCPEFACLSSTARKLCTKHTRTGVETCLQSLGEASTRSYVMGSDLHLPLALPPPPPVNGSAPPQIAAVYTAEDFQRAFHDGVQDIELRVHLDTRQLGRMRSPRTGGGALLSFGAVRDSTRSIRV